MFRYDVDLEQLVLLLGELADGLLLHVDELQQLLLLLLEGGGLLRGRDDLAMGARTSLCLVTSPDR